MITFILEGRIPSKKNSKIITRHGLISSAKYREWEDTQLWLLPNISSPVKKCEIEIIFTFPDLRSADLTNKAESIMDLLVKGGILLDDSWQVVNKVTLISKGCKKLKPIVEITINEN